MNETNTPIHTHTIRVTKDTYVSLKRSSEEPKTVFAKNDASSQSPVGCAHLKTTFAFEVSFAFILIRIHPLL